MDEKRADTPSSLAIKELPGAFRDAWHDDFLTYDKHQLAWVFFQKGAESPSVGANNEPGIAVQELENIVNAKRFDRDYFQDDTEFANWVRSRCQYTLGKIEESATTPAATATTHPPVELGLDTPSPMPTDGSRLRDKMPLPPEVLVSAIQTPLASSASTPLTDEEARAFSVQAGEAARSSALAAKAMPDYGQGYERLGDEMRAELANGSVVYFGSATPSATTHNEIAAPSGDRASHAQAGGADAGPHPAAAALRAPSQRNGAECQNCDDSRERPATSSVAPTRACSKCGTSWDAPVDYCPQCGDSDTPMTDKFMLDCGWESVSVNGRQRQDHPDLSKFCRKLERALGEATDLRDQFARDADDAEARSAMAMPDSDPWDRHCPKCGATTEGPCGWPTNCPTGLSKK